MQFKTIINIAFLAMTVSATPLAEPSVNAKVETAFHELSVKKSAGCNVIKCVAALAPTLVVCAAAIAEEGINIIADYACIAAAANSGLNTPSACKHCF